MDSDDDRLIDELATADQQRQIDDLRALHRELAGVVAELSKKLLALETPSESPRQAAVSGRWRWEELTRDERAVALEELSYWMRTTLARYPKVLNHLRPCWSGHTAVVDSLTATYGMWQMCFGEKANAEQFGHWLDRWLPALDRVLVAYLGQCTNGQHKPDIIETKRLG